VCVITPVGKFYSLRKWSICLCVLKCIPSVSHRERGEMHPNIWDLVSQIYVILLHKHFWYHNYVIQQQEAFNRHPGSIIQYTYLQLIWKIFCYQLLQCLVCHTCQTCRQGLQELRQFFPCSGVMVLPFDLLKNSFPKGCYGCLINQKELSLYLADKQIIANVTNHLTKS
jgi:hypothetical protein